MDVVDALGVTAGQLVAADELRRLRRERQETIGNEPVVQHQVGLRQTLDGAEGKQAGIAGTGADQGDRIRRGRLRS